MERTEKLKLERLILSALNRKTFLARKRALLKTGFTYNSRLYIYELLSLIEKDKEGNPLQLAAISLEALE